MKIESLKEYIEAGIKANTGTNSESDHGMKIAGESILYQLKKAIERIEALDGPYMASGDSDEFVKHVSVKEVLEILRGQNTQN